MTHIDCSLQVFEVMLGDNVIGIMQNLDVEKHMQSFADMRGGQHRFLTQGDTITVRLLMTREQKVLYAVMQRLMKDIHFTVDMHDEGKYLINGMVTLPAETLKDFAEKKHAENEVEFVFENATLEIVKERKHGKARIY